jgi:uncharacterized protein (TIGR02996 family)
MTWARASGGVVVRPTRPPILDEERRMLDAIIADPDDDGPRIVYADWLIMQADPELAARGELIVVQCALENIQDVAEHNRLKARDFELIERHGSAWCAHVGLGEVRNNKWDIPLVECDFRRGFIETASLWASDYPSVVGPLFAHEPVRRLVLVGTSAVLERLPTSVYLRRLSGLVLRPSETYWNFGGRVTRDRREVAMPTARVEALTSSQHVANLTELAIEGAGIGDRGAEAIARARSLGSIRQLSLRDNGIGADGVTALAASPLAKQLETLVLDDNPLDAAAIDELVRTPQFDNLRRLSLSAGTLGEAARARLAKRFGPALALS